MTESHGNKPNEHHDGLEQPDVDERLAGAPEPDELVREGRDPGWPIPGLAGPPPEGGSPASDTDAPAPG